VLCFYFFDFGDPELESIFFLLAANYLVAAFSFQPSDLHNFFPNSIIAAQTETAKLSLSRSAIREMMSVRFFSGLDSRAWFE